MNLKDLNDAIFEASRFIEKAREAKKRYEADKMTVYFTASKESGAVKRASMDLSRALTRLRSAG